MIEIRYEGRQKPDYDYPLPISKSVMNREFIIAALAQSLPESISSELPDDIGILHEALRSQQSTIDLHHAGTAMRFGTAYFACLPGVRILDGSSRMRQRPIYILVDALRALGARIDYLREVGYPPLKVHGGELQGGELEISGEVSSQYISALLLVGAQLPLGLTLQLISPVVSRPYIDLTLEVLRQQGISYSRDQDRITIPHQKVAYKPGPQERDWSAAAFAYGLVAQGAPHKLHLPGLRLSSAQGDRALAEYYAVLGVVTREEEGGLSIERKTIAAKQIRLDMSPTPDLAQAIVMTCAALGIGCHLTGLSTLRVKETDRIHAMQECLAQVGIPADTGDDFIRFEGTISPTVQPVFETYQDHRMAMSLALLSPAIEVIKIKDEGVVSKSFPQYWKVLHNLGYTIRHMP